MNNLKSTKIGDKIANLISKLNFYKLIPYPMDNCFTSRRDRSRQTSEKFLQIQGLFLLF